MHNTHTLFIRRSDAPDAKPGYYRAFGSASFLDDKQRVIFPLGKDKYEIKAGPGSKVGEKKRNLSQGGLAEICLFLFLFLF